MHSRHILIEYIVRGCFLGLSAGLAIWAASPRDVGIFGLLTLTPAVAGVLFALLTTRANRRSLRRSFGPRVILGLIDHPGWIHAAVLVGAIASAVLLQWPTLSSLGCVAAGALFGGTVYSLHRVRSRRTRRWLSVALLVAGVGGSLYLSAHQLVQPAGSPTTVALAIFLTSIVYYVLLFSGRSEESEFDIAIVCLGFCLALASLDAPRTVRSMVILGPLAVYVVYCERIRKNLVVFKHAIRGMDYEQSGRLREALVQYRLAIDSDPRSDLALAGNWRVHQKLDLSRVGSDDALLEMIDPSVCLERAKDLLTRGDNAFFEEALKLLDIVAIRDPSRRFEAGRLRVNALLALNRVDDAIAHSHEMTSKLPANLASLSNDEVGSLFGVWTSLLQEPALAASGSALLAQPERLPMFLTVLEEQLRRAPKDELAQTFRPFAYRKLSLADAERGAAAGRSDWLDRVDWRYVQQVARELATSPEDRGRAVELLQAAEIGLPAERFSIWLDLARIHEADGREMAMRWHDRIFQEGVERFDTLSETERAAVFESARCVALSAQEQGDVDRAIQALEVYSKSTQSGVQTRRRLMQLHEDRGDRVAAIRQVHAALVFQLSESDKRAWTAERDRLYRTVEPSEIQSRAAEAAPYFDVSHCLSEASRLFDEGAPSGDILHYLDLASAVATDRLLEVNSLLGRLHLREHRVDDAAACFQAVADNKPSRFRDKDQERCYFRACRILGELLVDRLKRPADAVGYLLKYKDQLDSGADTLFLLARAYEESGQIPQALKWYDMVLVYPSHPKAAAAKDALVRLK